MWLDVEWGSMLYLVVIQLRFEFFRNGGMCFFKVVV